MPTTLLRNFSRKNNLKQLFSIFNVVKGLQSNRFSSLFTSSRTLNLDETQLGNIIELLTINSHVIKVSSVKRKVGSE